MHPQTAHDPIDESLPPGGGRCNHRRHIKDFPGVLDVVAVISNPCRYQSRYNLYRAFERDMIASGVRLTTVEVAFANRPFELTEKRNPRHLQLRTTSECWQKESSINLGIERLPRDWTAVAWIDCDVQFNRPDFAQETLHALQHYAVVQMWTHARDLGPNYEPMDEHLGFVYCYLHPEVMPAKPGTQPDPYGPYTETPPGSKIHYAHPGYAWAARREAIEALGGLPDFAVLGAGDHHFAKALVGRVADSAAPGIHPRYREMLEQLEDKAVRLLRKNIGYVGGSINHFWHGRKALRKYASRWQILVESAYDPSRDIQKDWQGLIKLHDDGSERFIKLRDDIRRYLRERNEDGTDV